jgi:UDP-glucose 6-dehydrogenase
MSFKLSAAANEMVFSPLLRRMGACKDAHAIHCLTEWDEFTDYDWQAIYDSMQNLLFLTEMF